MSDPEPRSPKNQSALDGQAGSKEKGIPRKLPLKFASPPYPSQYVSHWKMKNGMEVLLRPIRPEDEPAMVKFHEMLSDRSVYLRFFNMQKLSARVAHERLIRRCVIDYEREMAFVVECANPASGEAEIIGVGRLIGDGDNHEAEVAILIADEFHHQGLGAELMARLIQVGRDKKLERLVAAILPENMAMRALAARFGFAVRKSDDMSVVETVLTL
jgi:acetyltransferase